MSQDKTSPPPGQAAQPEPARPAGDPPVASQKKRLLVVDDEHLVARSVMRMLQSEHQVELAGSVGEARRRLAAAPAFDAVLCDLMMPDGTGMDLFDWLGEAQPALASRMVFMTGGAFTKGASDFLARVPNPRLDKPFTPQALRDAVRAALK